MKLITWIWIFLILIPLAIIGFSIYWVVLVSEPILMAACNPGRVALAVLIMVAALVSAVFAFLAFRSIPEIKYTGPLFHIYIITTIVGIILCGVAMVASSPEGQAVCTSQIGTYLATHSDGRTEDFTSTYNTDYKKTQFYYAFGERAYEAYLIIGCAWVASLVTFFAMAEL